MRLRPNLCTEAHDCARRHGRTNPARVDYNHAPGGGKVATRRLGAHDVPATGKSALTVSGRACGKGRTVQDVRLTRLHAIEPEGSHRLARGSPRRPRSWARGRVEARDLPAAPRAGRTASRSRIRAQAVELAASSRGPARGRTGRAPGRSPRAASPCRPPRCPCVDRPRAHARGHAVLDDPAHLAAQRVESARPRRVVVRGGARSGAPSRPGSRRGSRDRSRACRPRTRCCRRRCRSRASARRRSRALVAPRKVSRASSSPVMMRSVEAEAIAQRRPEVVAVGAVANRARGQRDHRLGAVALDRLAVLVEDVEHPLHRLVGEPAARVDALAEPRDVVTRSSSSTPSLGDAATSSRVEFVPRSTTAIGCIGARHPMRRSRASRLTGKGSAEVHSSVHRRGVEQSGSSSGS